MASTIVNPAGSTVVFGTSGAAISGQPTNDKSTFVSGGLSQDNAASVAEVSAASSPNTVSRSLYGYLDKKAIASVVLAPGSGDYLSFSSGEPLEKGDFILTDLGRVVSVTIGGGPGAEIDVLTADLADYFTGSEPDAWKLEKNAVKKTRNGEYIYVGTPNIAGAANDAIQGGFTSPNRSANQSEAVRTVRTAEQVRAGSWNPYTGSWDTEPTAADDTSIINSANDKAYQTGRVTFSNGNTTTTTDL